MKTIDLTPTRDGFAHMATLFAQQADQAHANAKRAERLADLIYDGVIQMQISYDDIVRDVDYEDFDFISTALEGYAHAETVRAGTLLDGAEEAQRGVKWHDAGCPGRKVVDVDETASDSDSDATTPPS